MPIRLQRSAIRPAEAPRRATSRLTEPMPTTPTRFDLVSFVVHTRYLMYNQQHTTIIIT